MKELIYIVAGAFCLALVKPFYDFILKLIDNMRSNKDAKSVDTVSPFVTHEQLSETKTAIYNDITGIIKDAKNEFATKESVDALRQDFRDVKADVKAMSVIMTAVDKTMAVMADRQKRREGDCKEN